MRKMLLCIVLSLGLSASAQTPIALKTSLNEVHAVALSDDAQIVAYGSYNKVHIIDSTTHEQIMVCESDGGDIYELDIVGNKIIAGGDTSIVIWDKQTGELSSKIITDRYNKTIIDAKNGRVFSVGTHITGWDIDTGKQTMRSAELPCNVRSISISPDGNYIAVAPKYGTGVHLFDTKTGDVTTENIPNTRDCAPIAFHPNGTSLFIKSTHEGLHEVSLSGDLIRSLDYDHGFNQITVSKTGKYLLAPCFANGDLEIEELLIYDIGKNEKRAVIPISEKANYEAKISTAGDLVVVATKSPYLYFINLEE